MKERAVVLQGIAYSRFGQKILNNIDLAIDEGDFVIVVGANGSGKSTLLKVLNGTVRPDCGQVIVDDQGIVGQKIHQTARIVATLTQDLRHSTFSELTVAMNLDLALSRSSTSNKIDKKTYLSSFNPSLTDRLDVMAGQLSGGQRQSLALAMCFAHTPKLLLLDEHTSALDPKAQASLMTLTNAHVGEKKLTTIMVTHSLEQALQFGNRLVVIKDGQIAADINALEKAALSKNDLIALAY